LGNLAWHPDWSPACKDRRRADRRAALGFIAGMQQSQPGDRRSTGRDFLAGVLRLGEVDGRPLLGVLLDTTDEAFDFLGIAGSEGGISLAQLAWLREAVARYPGAFLIAFGHHPFAELSYAGRRRFEVLAGEWGTRLLGLVTAHTHLAAVRPHPLFTEYLVGSTIDPPQEAALLEVWPGPKVRIGTLQSVARNGSTCDQAPGAVTDKECAAAIASLEIRCPDLLAPRLDPPVGTPPELAEQQKIRAARLAACYGLHGGVSSALEFDELYRTASETTKRELVCLSWAASIMQGHKKQRWALKQAARFGFDASAAFGALAVDLPPPPAGRPRR
jgi:hypothetical protein